jgi:hypothetical protein
VVLPFGPPNQNPTANTIGKEFCNLEYKQPYIQTCSLLHTSLRSMFICCRNTQRMYTFISIRDYFPLGDFFSSPLCPDWLWPTQPTIQCVPGSFTPGYRGRGPNLTTHLHIVLRLRMCGAVSPLPQYIFMAWYLVRGSENFTLVRY